MSRLHQWRTLLSLSLCLLVYPPILTTQELNEVAQRQADEDFISVEEEEVLDDRDQVDVFVPTSEWQVVREGQHIPPGLHVRMNLQTGLKEAKLLDREEVVKPHSNNDWQEGMIEDAEPPPSRWTGDTRRKHHYGESDRRGVINKRTKVFSAEEVESMLEEMNSANTDLEHLPLLASAVEEKDSDMAQNSDSKPSQLKADLAGPREQLPVSLHREVEEMLQLTKVLVNRSSSEQELCQALEELEFYVHQINNAKDLDSIGGLVLVVRLLNHTSPQVKSWAARVIGSASQSNPPVQEQALEYGSLTLLCRLLALSEPEIVQRRALFALSALLRGNAGLQVQFIKKHRGLSILGDSFRQRSPQVQAKAVLLLTDFLNEELVSAGVREKYLELPILVYSEVLSAGWCTNIPLLIQSDQVAMVEKGLLAMRALSNSGTCNFSPTAGRLRALVRWFESSQESELDAEYAANLLEHCKELLKEIRKQHLDL